MEGDLTMQPRGPLMIEHRLIERMIERIKTELQQIEQTGKADPLFVDVAVDFIRTYADRTHHGKEEQIMFRELGKKELSEKDRSVMDELVQEHILGRELTADLVEANRRYKNGIEKALSTIVVKLKTLVDFYPKHIEKEDKHFFYPCQEYFSKDEQEKMLAEFWEFDRKMIHEKYNKVVEEYSLLTF